MPRIKTQEVIHIVQDLAASVPTDQECGHSEKNLTSSFYRLMKLSAKFHVVAKGFSDLRCLMNTLNLR